MSGYREKAIRCVKDTVLPLQRKMFQECGGDLDAQYQKYGTSDGFFANIIQPGRIYEMGYPKCVCPEVLSGAARDPAHCECSRQSIACILESLLPDRCIAVETVETVLTGADRCRFLVTVE